MINTLTIFGTRPEAIKLAPLLDEFSSRDEFRSLVCSTGQHLEMLEGPLAVFDLSVDYDLGLMEESQSLSGLTSRALNGLDEVLKDLQPDLVVVQGDTTTAFVGALTSFYHGIPVGHVEAGLRSGDKSNPFPEEVNRRLTDSLSDLHFAPTENSRDNLLNEGYSERSISVTGNTVIDALQEINGAIRRGELTPNYPIDVSPYESGERRMILVTSHRRESLDGGIAEICRGLKRIVEKFSSVEIVFPVHLNPKVRKTVDEVLGEADRIHLIEPVDYLTFVGLMGESYLIITDSGGIQEEGPALGLPVLVARDKTERPEALEAGTAKLVGTDQNRIFEETTRLLEDRGYYEEMAKASNPFGRGDAAEKIADRILQQFG
ncbi:MAG: non-hydrolyzing UDP-N-acetylglucosamine 2-epimerase [Candidatus Acetothermia bacterium]